MNNKHQLERINYILDLFNQNPQLFDHNQVPAVTSQGAKKVIGELPLKHHIVHGETILYINETLENGEIKKFRYGWERSQRKRKLGKQLRFITSFDKQAHPDPPYNVATDPFHHHYDTNHMNKRTETYVEELDTVIPILTDYIVSGRPYDIEDRYY